MVKNNLLIYSIWLSTTLLVSPACSAEDLMVSYLVDQAHAWEQKDRPEMAQEIWHKILRADPNHREAQVKLGITGTRIPSNKSAEIVHQSLPKVGLSASSAESPTVKRVKESVKPVAVPIANLDVAVRDAQKPSKKAIPSKPSKGAKIKAAAIASVAPEQVVPPEPPRQEPVIAPIATPVAIPIATPAQLLPKELEKSVDAVTRNSAVLPQMERLRLRSSDTLGTPAASH